MGLLGDAGRRGARGCSRQLRLLWGDWRAAYAHLQVYALSCWQQTKCTEVPCVSVRRAACDATR